MEESIMRKISPATLRRSLIFGLFLVLLVPAARSGAQGIGQPKPNLSVLPDFEVVDIEFTLTHHIFAKIRNNSPSSFSGNVEMGLQFAGYGLVYRDRVFNLNLPAHGQIVSVEMPCDVPADKMRLEQDNAVGILIGIDSNKKIPELNDNNNTLNKKFPLGITAITLTLLPDSYQGVCNASTPVKTVARIAFRCNLSVTERYKIILEYPSAGFRKEYQDQGFIVTANPGTKTVNQEIVFPTDLATTIQHGTGQMSLRVELFWSTKNMASNAAAFTYRCL
jgi:hypothetical protein